MKSGTDTFLYCTGLMNGTGLVPASRIFSGKIVSVTHNGHLLVED